MRKTAGWTLVGTLVLGGAFGTATALAGVKKGKTYEGSVPAYGTSSEHRKARLYAGGKIQLRVSRSGKTVTVHFTSSTPVLYCRTVQTLKVQNSKASSISSSGSFKAIVDERFKAGPGAPGIIQTVSGHFSGGYVSGTIRTQAGDCSGSTSFSARVPH